MGFTYTSKTTLRDLAGPRVQTATRHAMRKMAREGAERMRDLARERTPVDTGEVAGRWRVSDVRIGERDGLLVFEASAFNSHHVALWLESGVEEHVLPRRGRGPMTFTAPGGGEEVVVRRIEHPGFAGLGILASAATLTEAQYRAIVGPVVDDWRRDVQRAMRGRP